MKIVQNILTKNPCYTAGKKITVKGLMLHSVGCPQPNALTFCKNWNSSSFSRACVHAFIDANNGTIYQTLPWNHRGWHGGGSSNNTHIGVEMCEPGSIKYTSGSSFTCSDKAGARAAATRTYNAAVELFAYLCKEYKLDPLKNICSHKEGYKKGIASNHGDPEHLWKGLGLSYTMDTFRADVKKAMGGSVVVTQPTTSSSSSKTNKIPSKVPFTVEVLIPDLNYRSLPSMSGAVKGQTGKATFTIIEVKDVWGKLKSGAGWICLENPNYVKIGSTVASSTSNSTSNAKKVQITASALNVRAGAGTSYKVNTVVKKGDIYTIVETKNGWGKLKSGAGWISLAYTKEVK